LADVIALARPRLTADFASSGNGTVQHLCLEISAHDRHQDHHHIPYRGGGPALNDVMGGQREILLLQRLRVIGQVRPAP